MVGDGFWNKTLKIPLNPPGAFFYGGSNPPKVSFLYRFVYTYLAKYACYEKIHQYKIVPREISYEMVYLIFGPALPVDPQSRRK